MVSIVEKQAHNEKPAMYELVNFSLSESINTFSLQSFTNTYIRLKENHRLRCSYYQVSYF